MSIAPSFETVRADRYLFQCTVRHMLPNPEVIQQLIEARCGDDYEVHFTHRDFKDKGYVAQRDAAIEAAERLGGFRAVWRDADEASLMIDLEPRA